MSNFSNTKLKHKRLKSAVGRKPTIENFGNLAEQSFDVGSMKKNNSIGLKRPKSSYGNYFDCDVDGKSEVSIKTLSTIEVRSSGFKNQFAKKKPIHVHANEHIMKSKSCKEHHHCTHNHANAIKLFEQKVQENIGSYLVKNCTQECHDGTH